jgi:hypothetical protein
MRGGYRRAPAHRLTLQTIEVGEWAREYTYRGGLRLTFLPELWRWRDGSSNAGCPVGHVGHIQNTEIAKPTTRMAAHEGVLRSTSHTLCKCGHCGGWE